jgi:carbamate kinase
VVEHRNELRGVEAVVDKDLAAARLATLVGASLLLILTAVDRVYSDFGTDRAVGHDRLTVAQAQRLLRSGELPDGSMGPKVAACVEFVRAGGPRAVIAALDDAEDAVFGRAGTEVVP